MLRQHILIVGPSWVGDMVMVQSLLFSLKTQDQQCLIDVIAPFWAVSVAERMPEVNAVIELPIGHGQFVPLKRYQIGCQLREKNYSRAIILPNSWKSALIPFFAGIPWRTGYIGECRWGLLNDARILDKQGLIRTVERFVALADKQAVVKKPDINPPRLQVDQNHAGQLARQYCDSDSSQPILAICPGAEYGAAKQWPETHYASIARYYFSRGWAVWLFGSKKDRIVCQTIIKLADIKCIDLSGQTTLLEAIDLLSLTSIVVSNDSGLMHVAAALNKPLIGLFGSSSPEATPPLGDQSHALSLSLPCSPCYLRECRYGHRNCLTRMTPEMVIQVIDAACMS